LWLDENITAPTSAFMPPNGSREFAHLHQDGSFHLVIADADEREVIEKGWGLPHPWKNRGVNEILVNAPRNSEEIGLLKLVIEASYHFAIQEHL